MESTVKRDALFEKIKIAILGKDYDLSVVFVRSPKMRELNRSYRNIDTSTDILSFPLSKNEGEIYICLSEAKKEAVKFDRSYDNFIYFLFVHGLVHLKGFDHSSTMERIEVRYRKMFNI
jgi:probable rRNA maturation factor